MQPLLQPLLQPVRSEHFDLGLCARPNPQFHSDSPEFCGAFRTPSLRNVALRESFMHSGVFSSLRDVVSFYASRSTNPHRWYKGPEFDDVPARYREYVNVDKAPSSRSSARSAMRCHVDNCPECDGTSLPRETIENTNADEPFRTRCARVTTLDYRGGTRSRTRMKCVRAASMTCS